MDACQTARLSHVSQLLQFCFILLLDQVICVLPSHLQPWPVWRRCAAQTRRNPARSGVGCNRREAAARHKERAQPADHSAVAGVCLPWFILHYIKNPQELVWRRAVCWPCCRVHQRPCLCETRPKEEVLAQALGQCGLWVLSTALGPAPGRSAGATYLPPRPLQLLLGLGLSGIEHNRRPTLF